MNFCLVPGDTVVEDGLFAGDRVERTSAHRNGSNYYYRIEDASGHADSFAFLTKNTLLKGCLAHPAPFCHF